MLRVQVFRSYHVKVDLTNVDGCEQIADIVLEIQEVNKCVVVQRQRLDNLVPDALNSLELWRKIAF
jgi:hypothetical protein